MTTYLSGKIVPLTPSNRPTNVDHLARKATAADQDNVDGSENREQESVDHPVAIPDRRSYCTIS